LLISIKSPDRMRAVNPREGAKMGGGSYSGLTPQGMIAAGIAHNPEYGKLAADSIAKEVAERNLVGTTASADDAAPGAEQATPASATAELAKTDLSQP
jgi:hypothetical protein